MNEGLAQLKRINKQVKEQLWNNSMRLGCLKLRFNNFLNSWISLNEDPCPTCKNKKCHNHGKPFEQTKRLIVLGEA